jgi:HSP20 family protein
MFFPPFGSTPARNPFRDLERFVEDLTSSFQRSFPRTYAGASARTSDVPLNVWSNDQSLVITAEVPGVDPTSIAVNVLGDAVTISGKRAEGANGAASFTRTVHLPFRVDAERTEARCVDGVLSVTLHRPEAERPRTIAVKTA